MAERLGRGQRPGTECLGLRGGPGGLGEGFPGAQLEGVLCANSGTRVHASPRVNNSSVSARTRVGRPRSRLRSDRRIKRADARPLEPRIPLPHKALPDHSRSPRAQIAACTRPISGHRLRPHTVLGRHGLSTAAPSRALAVGSIYPLVWTLGRDSPLMLDKRALHRHPSGRKIAARPRYLRSMREEIGELLQLGQLPPEDDLTRTRFRSSPT